MSKCLVKPALTGPCPFCGATQSEVIHPVMSRYAVRCTACKAQGPWRLAKNEAVGAWDDAGRAEA